MSLTTCASCARRPSVRRCPVAPFDTDDDAVRLANDSEFGLAASVWTGNRKRGEAIAARIKAGTVMINDAISGFGIAEAPHGGFKQSGIGRTHGKLGLAEMVQVKYVDVDLLPRMPKVWWYGYGASFPAPDVGVHRHAVRQQPGSAHQRSAGCDGRAAAVQSNLTATGGTDVDSHRPELQCAVVLNATGACFRYCAATTVLEVSPLSCLIPRRFSGPVAQAQSEVQEAASACLQRKGRKGKASAAAT